MEPSGASGRNLTLIVFFSLLGGTSSLVFIPFIDDWLLHVVRRRMIRELLKRNGYVPNSPLVVSLAGPYFPNEGCLYQSVFSLLLLPIRLVLYLSRRIFRKLFYFLAVKEATDRASLVFHEGYLFDYALKKSDPDSAGLSRIRPAVEKTIRTANTSPIRNIFAGVIRLNKRIIFDSASLLSQLAGKMRGKREPEQQEETAAYLDQEEKLLTRLTSRVTEMVTGQSEHLKGLEDRFDYLFSTPQTHA